MLCFAWPLLVIVIMTLMSAATMQLTSDNNCTQLEFLNVKDDIIHTTVGRDINIAFSLRFENCSTTDRLVVTISKKSKSSPLPTVECKIIYNQSTCTVSKSSPACNCKSATAPATFTTKANGTGNLTYVWTLRHNTSEDNERTVTVVVSGDDSMKFSFNMIILGSIVGSLAVITVASVLCVVFYKKRDKKTFELLPRAPRGSGVARNPSGQGQAILSKRQHSMGQYEEVHDSLFHQRSEDNVYYSRSRPRRDTSRHNMSQDRADLLQQSSGSIYGQVYDDLMLRTFTGDTPISLGPQTRVDITPLEALSA
ncbi:uncharacterized protein LOC112569151 [Pomacea canaliculata]|uniref:uncharacterized protein LOC112569151 n=1 Tax=Pomacea canaliculata TaxID=400727 RepID=UPI000D728835|nr:uncharacterized protein LOC112569151 [Pomacea canaliculata]